MILINHHGLFSLTLGRPTSTATNTANRANPINNFGDDTLTEALEEPATIKPALAEFEALAGLAQAAAEPVLA